MSDHPGCHCGHPHAEPEWIDHNDGCPYFADVDEATMFLAAAQQWIGKSAPDLMLLRGQIIRIFAEARERG